VLQFKKVQKKKVYSEWNTEIDAGTASLAHSPNAGGGGRKKKQKAQRYIAQAPERILDAPELLDDFYLNLLDWSEKNIVAIALGHTVSQREARITAMFTSVCVCSNGIAFGGWQVYLWNATTGGITQLMETEEEGNHITSVKWGGGGSYLAIGLNDSSVQLWDGEACQQVRTMYGHEGRVGALAWNGHLLSSGSRDTTVVNHDVRIATHNIATIRSHGQEVCGMQWNPTGTQLATGGNDNLLSIWDASTSSQRCALTAHTAAVKALAWCPFTPNLLASGGGTADRTIRFWNTVTGQTMHTVDTKSQVCSLLWSKKSKELLSSHGFSQNQLTLWKYPTMTKVIACRTLPAWSTSVSLSYTAAVGGG